MTVKSSCIYVCGFDNRTPNDYERVRPDLRKCVRETLNLNANQTVALMSGPNVPLIVHGLANREILSFKNAVTWFLL
jgi:hypothetical protein